MASPKNSESNAVETNSDKTALPTDAQNTPVNASTVEVPEKSASNNVMVRLPWTHPVLKGDEEGEEVVHGFPTLRYPHATELTPEQYEKAKVAARTSRFRLKEVG